MSATPTETALMLAALMLAAAPIQQARVLRATGAAVPPWVPFAVLSGLGIASAAFAVLNPGLSAVLWG
jgi:hypothetical protein